MARTQTGGLGRGIDSLFTSSESALLQRNTEKAAEPKQEPAPEVAPAPAAPVADKPGEDRTLVTLSEEVRATTIDDSSMADILDAGNVTSDVVIRERAPRPKKEEAAPAPEQAPVSVAAENVAPAAMDAAPVELAPQPLDVTAIPDGSIAEISLGMIDPNPFQPRLRFKEEQLEELAASIARDGLIQPITVRPMLDGRFQIVSGERRFRASIKAGRPTVPAYILAATDREMAEFALVENLQREDLNPIEAAIGYRNMMKSQNLTQADLARVLCKGRSTIANTLRLLELPEDLQEMIYNEQITEGHARAIQGVPTEEGRKKLAEKVIAEGLSVRATESIARLMAGRAEGEEEPPAAERVAIPAAFKVLAKNLKKRLDTNVKVKNSGGKNKLEIEFADAEDLERICKALLGE